jgi:hypothetical protein
MGLLDQVLGGDGRSGGAVSPVVKPLLLALAAKAATGLPRDQLLAELSQALPDAWTA